MKKVLVIGDVIVDVYRYGTPLGISAATPTIVSEYIHGTETHGGAALVARHLHHLDESDLKYRGVNTKVLSIGDYIQSGMLSDGLHHKIINLKGWKTPVKERIVVGGYKLAQLDTLNKIEHTSDTEDEFMKLAVSLIDEVDEVVIADNRHGVINKNIACRLVNYCWSAQKRMYVDSQVSQSSSNHVWYYSANVFFMNMRELNAVTKQLNADSHVSKKLELAQDLLGSELIILKDGSNGAGYYKMNDPYYYHTRPPKIAAVDTCGARDALMAYLVREYDGTKDGQRGVEGKIEE